MVHKYTFQHSRVQRVQCDTQKKKKKPYCNHHYYHQQHYRKTHFLTLIDRNDRSLAQLLLRHNLLQQAKEKGNVAAQQQQ